MIATMSAQNANSSEYVTITTPIPGEVPSAVGGSPSGPCGQYYLNISCQNMQYILNLEAPASGCRRLLFYAPAQSRCYNLHSV